MWRKHAASPCFNTCTCFSRLLNWTKRRYYRITGAVYKASWVILSEKGCTAGSRCGQFAENESLLCIFSNVCMVGARVRERDREDNFFSYKTEGVIHIISYKNRKKRSLYRLLPFFGSTLPHLHTRMLSTRLSAAQKAVHVIHWRSYFPNHSFNCLGISLTCQTVWENDTSLHSVHCVVNSQCGGKGL